MSWSPNNMCSDSNFKRWTDAEGAPTDCTHRWSKFCETFFSRRARAMKNTTMVLYDVASKLRICVMPIWTSTLHHYCSDRWLIKKLFSNLKLTWYILVIILANCDMITQTKFWCGLYKLWRIHSVNISDGANQSTSINCCCCYMMVCVYLVRSKLV